MKTKYLFQILLLLTLSAGILSFFFPEDSGNAVLIALRALCIASIAVMIMLRRGVLRQSRSITNGFNLLKAQDFGSRLAHVGQPDADEIVDMFNLLRSSLKEQRVHLREQNHFLDLLTDVSPMGIILLSDGCILSVNPAAARFLDLPSSATAERISLQSLSTPLGRILASLPPDETKTVRLSDSMIYRCSHLSFMDKGFEHPFLLIETLTEEVMKAERRSYGKVIRVIAHEVNNTVAGLDSLLAALETDPIDQSLLPSDRDEVVEACRSRCRSLGKFISTFVEAVKIPDPVRVRRDFNKCLRQWEVGLESLCRPRDIKLRMDLSPGSLALYIDPVLMEQVLINIVKNSAESIGLGGEIVISTSVSPSGFIVTDTGPGISEECSEMLFSPFFTTKEEGHGIGLLFVSEVLHNHGCRFSLVTGSDGLTRFTVVFS